MKVPTKFVSPLSSEQIKELRNLWKNDSSHQFRIRAHSILLSSEKLSIDEIANIYKVHRNSVSSWIDAWEQSKINGLRDLPRSGAPPKLTKHEREIVRNLIKEQPCSPNIVLSQLEELTDKLISRSTLKRIARAANLRWKRIRKSLKAKRNEKEFKKAKAEISELQKLEQAGKIDIWYFDESGFSLDPSVRYAWQPIGETLEIPATKSKRLNVLGFLNTKNQLEPFSFECNIDTEIVIRCFNEFSKKIKKKQLLFLIMLQCIAVMNFKIIFHNGKKRAYFSNTYQPILLN